MTCYGLWGDENCSEVYTKNGCLTLPFIMLMLGTVLQADGPMGQNKNMGSLSWEGACRYYGHLLASKPKSTIYSASQNFLSFLWKESSYKSIGSAVSLARQSKLHERPLQTQYSERRQSGTASNSGLLRQTGPQSTRAGVSSSPSLVSMSPGRGGCHLPSSACVLLVWLPDYY